MPGPRRLRTLATVSGALALATLGIAVQAVPAQAATERARITWNKANDIDLHVYDAEGRHAFYQDPEAIPDAELSPDVTNSGGPETFVDQREPSTRRLRFQVCYFSESGDATGPTEVVATIQGLPTQTVTVTTPGECQDVGETGDSDAADLAIRLDPGAAVVTPGKPTLYTATVSNNGPGLASGVSVAAEFGDEVTVVGDAGKGCVGRARLICGVGTLGVGESRQFRILAIPRHPSGGGVIAAINRPAAATEAVARVESATPDPNPGNGSDDAHSLIRNRVSRKRPPRVAARRVRARASVAIPTRLAKGWYSRRKDDEVYWFGIDPFRRSQQGYKFGYGGFTFGTRMFMTNKPKQFGFYSAMYVKAEYRLRLVAVNQYGGAVYSTVKPNGAGSGSESTGYVGTFSWNVASAPRLRTKTLYFASPNTTFSFRSPGQKYVLEARYRYFRDTALRDKEFDSGWLHHDSIISGGGA